jgi:murein DD-endopeptidase MepM/ murein hydrolase activator NlpD
LAVYAAVCANEEKWNQARTILPGGCSLKVLKTAPSLRAYSTVFVIVLTVLLLLVTAQAYAKTSDEVRAEANAMMEKLDAIQTEINDTQAEYDQAVADHDAAVKAMDAAQAKIEEAEKKIAENQEKLRTRAVAIYRKGNVSMVDVVLGATSFEDFVTMSNMVESINQRDAEMVEASRQAKAEAQEARDEYEHQSQVAEENMQKAKDAEAKLQAKADEMSAEIDRLTEEAAELQAQEEAAAEEARKAREAAEAEAKRIEAERAAAAGASTENPDDSGYDEAGESVVTGNGQFSHPCPGYNSISSTFGYRSFDSSFHKGVDFAASQGTPIYAAASGTVVIAGYSSSAGNWVVISHGGGLTTKYMHMVSTPLVSAGQSVSAGENIGYVGTTGYSTGPHLHFQVEVNGTAVNPMYYL